jgi:GT2 family glycosyltransferase
MKIIAVVVTYNRLPLLRKSLQAIAQQTRKPDEVLVINNSSSDGTTEWLAKQDYTAFTRPNEGGAAGFSFGIKKAYEHGADWIWLMDDDTIPVPDALEQLTAALDKLAVHKERIGFLSSEVHWVDGSLHRMNRSLVEKKQDVLERFSFVTEAGFTLVKGGTFVSMLLSADAVEKLGLPIKEYFIWSDDVEYSMRIIASGLAGIEVVSSTVIHETPTNHKCHVLKDEQSAVWKYKYGLRNELCTRRLLKGEWSFWWALVKRMIVWPLHIMRRRKNHRWAYIKVVWQTSLQAITFRPSIEKVNSRHRTGKDEMPATKIIHVDAPTRKNTIG